MKSKKLFISIAMLIVVININVSAQVGYGFVMDKKTILQVAKNSTSMIAKEAYVLNSVTLGEKKQRDMQKDVLAIQAALELYRKSYENVEQFGHDNRNVKEIARLSKLIVEELKNTTTELRKNPKASISIHKQMLTLTEETAQCLKTCYSLITKSTVKQLANNNKKENDGLNWLNPKDRLDVGYYLVEKLDKILFTLAIIKNQAKYINTWGMALQEMAPYDWARVIRTKETADEIIKSFSKK